MEIGTALSNPKTGKFRICLLIVSNLYAVLLIIRLPVLS